MTTSSGYQGSYAGRTVCVTGGAGFIGSHLCDALVEHGAQVRVLDDFSNGRADNLNGAAKAARVVRGSITNEAALNDAIQGCSVVFHEAALGSVPQSVEMPAHFHEVNVTGTVKVMEACRRHGVQRVVYAASSSAYGNEPALPKTECMRPDTLSPYAYTKLAGEYILRSWGNCYTMQTVSLRYFNIFGPRQREDSMYAAVIPMFAKHLRDGTRPIIYGDGGQTRDFTHVANAVHANLLAGSTASKLKGQVVNVACGGKFSLLELVNAMAKVLGVEAKPDFQPERAGDVKESLADISVAEKLLGYRVIVPFEEGLRQTLLG